LKNGTHNPSVAQLKALAEKMNVKRGGTRDELISRLGTAIQAEKASNDSNKKQKK